jgi:hypothetical protein
MKTNIPGYRGIFLPLLGFSKSDENVCFSFVSTHGGFLAKIFFSANYNNNNNNKNRKQQRNIQSIKVYHYKVLIFKW